MKKKFMFYLRRCLSNFLFLKFGMKYLKYSLVTQGKMFIKNTTILLKPSLFIKKKSKIMNFKNNSVSKDPMSNTPNDIINFKIVKSMKNSQLKLKIDFSVNSQGRYSVLMSQSIFFFTFLNIIYFNKKANIFPFNFITCYLVKQNNI